VCALLLGGEAPSAPPPPAPLVGFSYSPIISTYLNRDPGADLATLLTRTNPDLVRLPVYWDLTQPSPGLLDFTVTDQLLEVVADHNRASPRPTRVILTVGARNFLFPELHAPAWAGPRQQPELGQLGPHASTVALGGCNDVAASLEGVIVVDEAPNRRG